jgi:cytochrome c556
MTIRSLARDLTLGGSLLFTACASPGATRPPQEAQLTRAVSPPARLGAPDHLPDAARAVLRSIMVAHARNMGDLMDAVMVLDYARITAGAEAVAEEASLSRPLRQEASELNSMLPEEFFRLQDALRAQARVLADSSRRQSPYGVAQAYGQLSETCVRCHHVYRSGAR